MKNMKLALNAFAFAAALSGGPRLQAHEMEMALSQHSGMMGEMSMDQMKELGLSDAQMQKMKSMHQAHLEVLKTLEGKLKFDIEQLRNTVNKEQPDDQLKIRVEAAQKAHKALMQVQQKEHEAMLAMLTPLQRGKLILSMYDHMKDGMTSPLTGSSPGL